MRSRLRHPRAGRTPPQRAGAPGHARRPPGGAHIGATFDLTDTAAALRHVADGKAIGKVVLDVSRTARH
ncbi:MAG: hypothetical protein ACLP8X_16515, partial [Streptosporangiaceae bacterium]